MKQYKYLYQKMLEEDTIRKAYKKLRKGKTARKEIIYIDEHLDEEVQKMREMIRNTRPGVVENPELKYVPHKRTPKIIREHGKERKIFMPEIHEQWFHHIIVLILEPIIMATAYRYSCGSFPGKGAHSGKRRLERWIRSGKGIKYFAKLDIRHFYNNIRLNVLMRELRIRIKDEWFLYTIEICLTGFKKGIPLGFYISQWLANYMLEPLDRFITGRLGFKITVRYMDDITFFSNNKKDLHKAIAYIRMFIGRRFRLKLKGNYQVCKFDYEKKGKVIGRPLDFMGFVFRRDRTTIRKKIMLSATRLARRLRKAKEAGRGYYQKNIQAMLSYMGWFTCTDTYSCYLVWIKPYIVVRNLKAILSKIQRRQNDERMDRREVLRAA